MRHFRYVSKDQDHPYSREAQEMRDKLAQAGYAVPLDDLVKAWDDYSDSMCATWMTAHDLDGDEIFARISSRLEEDASPAPEW
jgi:hypothetical protein